MRKLNLQICYQIISNPLVEILALEKSAGILPLIPQEQGFLFASL